MIDLEKEVDKILNKKISDLEIPELRVLLAYDYQKDGAEEDFVMEILEEDYWQNKELLIKTLTEDFGR